MLRRSIAIGQLDDHLRSPVTVHQIMRSDADALDLGGFFATRSCRVKGCSSTCGWRSTRVARTSPSSLSTCQPSA
jgi:hypothetical protein